MKKIVNKNVVLNVLYKLAVSMTFSLLTYGIIYPYINEKYKMEE